MSWLRAFDWFSVLVYFVTLCMLDLLLGHGPNCMLASAVDAAGHVAVNASLAFVLVLTLDPTNRRYRN